MEVIHNSTSPVATWYKYQPAGIKNAKDDTCFSKKVEI